MYQSRRDVLIEGLSKAGWNIEKPKATMFVWAEIPEPFKSMDPGICKTAYSGCQSGRIAGIGFGEYGDGYVRFCTRQKLSTAYDRLQRGSNKFYKWDLSQIRDVEIDSIAIHPIFKVFCISAEIIKAGDMTAKKAIN